MELRDRRENIKSKVEAMGSAPPAERRPENEEKETPEREDAGNKEFDQNMVAGIHSRRCSLGEKRKAFT